MTDTPGSQPPSSSDGQDRPPVDTQGVFTPPAPPPAPAPGQGYQYAAAALPPAKQKTGILGTLVKVTSVLGFLVAVFVIGVYVGVLGLASQDSGPVVASDYRAGTGEQVVAIIPVYGPIDGGSAEFTRLAVDAAINDESIQAVVIHVDSPGGMVGPSEQMHHHFQRLRRERPNLPIIASYASVAASGGYYVSCQADYIFCEPTGVTGSIGVIASIPIMKDLFEQKLGVKMLVLTADTSPDKDVANDVFRDWNERDTEAVQTQLTAMHARFREIVRAGRVDTKKMTEAQFADATEGLAYLAEAALDRGLIDEVGYLEDAIAMAVDQGDFEADDPPVQRYLVRPPLMSVLFGANHSPAIELSQFKLEADSLRDTLIEISAPQTMFLYRP